MLRRRLALALLAGSFAACAASPWTVRIENARPTDVPMVRCLVAWGEDGNAGSSDVRARYAIEFAGPRGQGAPVVDLAVYWVADAPPTRARITRLDPASDGITIRLAEPRTIELKDRRGNTAAQLQTLEGTASGDAR